MPTITPSDLSDLLAAQPASVVIDVRTPVEFSEVHVLQARNIPLDEFDGEKLLASGKIQKSAPVYLLCRSGGRAQKAASKLLNEGFTEPVVVEGGTLAWIDAGLPVERGTVKVMSLERQVRIAAGSLVFTGVVLGWFVHPVFFGFSAFVGAGLVFAGITDFCGMGLLLAKLPWNKRIPQ